MYQILTLNTISPAGLDILRKQDCEILQAADSENPDAILLRSFKLLAENIPPSVKAVARAGAGVNNIPVAECTRLGIPVFNAPGGNANAVKELVIAALLLSSRGIIQGIRHVEALADCPDTATLTKRLEAEKKQFKGVDLQGRTLGVVGLGSVGSKVAGAGLMLGMRVLGYDPALSVERAWSLPAEIEQCSLLEHLVRDSDYISLHVPALEGTRALVDAPLLSNFGPQAQLLNFARAEVVDLAAVVDALDGGRLGGYITDFPHLDLMGRDDVIQMPHIGASTREAEQSCATMVADQLYNFLATGNISNSVNFPSIHLEQRGKFRLAVSNDNRPKMLNAILSHLGDANINVLDMLNRSRENIAYNLIDLEQRPTESLLELMRSLEGVVDVRLITA